MPVRPDDFQPVLVPCIGVGMPQGGLLHMQARDPPWQTAYVQQRQADQTAATVADQHRADDLARVSQLQQHDPDQQQNRQKYDHAFGRTTRMQPLGGQMVFQADGGGDQGQPPCLTPGAA